MLLDIQRRGYAMLETHHADADVSGRVMFDEEFIMNLAAGPGRAVDGHGTHADPAMKFRVSDGEPAQLHAVFRVNLVG